MNLRPLLPLWACALAACFLLCSSPAFAQEKSRAGRSSWSYSGSDGPAHWGDLDPGYAACKTGILQSPIDIANAKPSDLPPIRFNYRISPLKILNDGHTIAVRYEPGSTISVGDQQYALLRFEFHHPSEMKVAGKQSDFSMDLVHADPQGNLAIVTVLFQEGQTNPFLDLLWRYVPKEIGKEVTNKKVNLDVAGLLPANRDYFSFQGSLTAPPCTPGVQWYVLKTPAELSSAELAAFAKWYPDNARPVQPSNAREILESK